MPSLPPLTEPQRALAAELYPDVLRVASKTKQRVFDHRWDDEYDSAAGFTLVLAVLRYNASAGVPLKHYVLSAVKRTLRILHRTLEPSSSRTTHAKRRPRITTHAKVRAPMAKPSPDAIVFQDLLSDLPDRSKKAVTDRFVHGMTIEEIADRDGVTRQTVQERLSMACAQLRERCRQ